MVSRSDRLAEIGCEDVQLHKVEGVAGGAGDIGALRCVGGAGIISGLPARIGIELSGGRVGLALSNAIRAIVWDFDI